MTTATQIKARLEVLDNAEMFTQALEAESRELKLLVEWTQGKPQLLPASGPQAAKIFAERFRQDSQHLHFRAFNEQVEYGWFGTIGVRVELTPEGELEVEGQDYCAEGLEVSNDVKVRVQRLMQNGRVIYEKLLEARIPSTVNSEAKGGG